MDSPIINKVADSGIISLDLEEFYPKEKTIVFDLKDFLFMGLILKEKDFREALKNLDWSVYSNSNIAVTCTADAIVPMWAYMLIASYLQPIANEIVFGNENKLIEEILLKRINSLDASIYNDKRVVVKGCGDIKIPETAYLQITNKLRPFAKSIMYGEPCSTVPIYKKPK
jgi:Protein of unknown function (DUF2480)